MDERNGATNESLDPSAGGNSGQSAGAPSAASSAVTLDLDSRSDDLEAAMREALAAVEAVEAAEAAEASGGRSEIEVTDMNDEIGAEKAVAANQERDREGHSRDDPNDPHDPNDPNVMNDPNLLHDERDEAEETSNLRREIADLRDRSMRTLADFDNFRKRSERERQEIRRYALLEPLREFLPIADNLERALSAGGSAEDLKRGVELILRQMQELLRRFGVHEVAAAGKPFNPAVHEAVAREESDQTAVPTVAETLVKGYLLHDRLLRPAMVKVLVPREKPAPLPTHDPNEAI
jgi:molecular chaperone GrpE